MIDSVILASSHKILFLWLFIFAIIYLLSFIEFVETAYYIPESDMASPLMFGTVLYDQ